jgi:hypothetical protein
VAASSASRKSSIDIVVAVAGSEEGGGTAPKKVFSRLGVESQGGRLRSVMQP